METVQTILLVAILAALLFGIYDRLRQHAELISLLNDQATMLGDMLDAILKRLKDETRSDHD